MSYAGIGFKSFDKLGYAFDVVNVSFDNTLVSLFTTVKPSVNVMTRVIKPTAPVMTRIAKPVAPTYTRIG
tara:strand:- start:216 stop:425 length:210 start_codon:yes stop_codon:yes gene_type:complete